MSAENSWVPVTPIKPPLRIWSPGEGIQHKSDGSTEEAQAGKIVACSDTSNLVTLDSQKILVVDLNEMKWVENDANCCSFPGSLEKSESISHGELSSKTIPHFVPPTPEKKTTVELKQVVQVQSSSAGEKRDEEGRTVSVRTDENGITKLRQYRRKHRPKVVTEGKPRTSKSGTRRAANSKENLTTKRKYVRKNAVNKPLETPLELGILNPVTPEVASYNENSIGLRTYIRKRGVCTAETPMEITGASTNVEVRKRKRSRKTCRRNLKFDNEGKQKDESSSCEYSSNISEFLVHILPTGNYHSHLVVQHRKESEAMLEEDCNCLPESQVSNLEIPIEYSTSQLKPQINHYKDQGSMGKTNSTNHLLSSSKESFCSSTTEARGIKQKCCHNIKQDDIRSSDLIEEFYNSIYASQMPHAEYFPKEKTEKVLHSGPSSTYTGQAYKVNSLNENPCASKASHWISRPQTRSCLTPGIFEGSVNLNKLQPFDFIERRCEDQSYVSTHMQSKYSPKQPQAITDLQRDENSHRHHPSLGAQFDKMQAAMVRKKRTRKPLTSSHSNMDGCYAGDPSEIISGLKLSTNAMVEEMNILDINKEGKISSCEEQNVMVPYNMQNQGHGMLANRGVDSVVPFEGSLVPAKKRRRHAKVDLDGETNRVWKLLVGNFNSEVDDGSDEARDKWWEEERRVFSGRANSFIAKMHLIQGDRGFSQWKGSVLDSVIGVFLTQNVSDHLSSSAFMSLAARFSLKPRSLHESSIGDPTSFVVTEPEVDIKWAEPEVDVNCGSNLSSEDISVNGSASSVEIIQIVETTKLKSNSKNVSGNDLSDEKLEGTCSTSEERYIDQRENDNADCPKSLLRESLSQSSHELQKTSISGVTEVQCFKMYRKITRFSYVYKRRDVYDTNEHAQTLDSASQTTVLNTNDVQATRHSRELCNVNQSDRDVVFQSEGRFIEVSHGVESQASMGSQKAHQTQQDSVIDSTLDFMRKTEEPDQSKHGHTLCNKFNDTKAGTPKSNGKRVKKEKKDDVNWDNLRKQAEVKGRRERTTTTMDSLDWEAVRCADVDEIAFTIRERGMNNRLAERIKGFLNRLVKDHGSTDLEWLRDVPPDQVKEYLLSVRGLGLKSVECVRLLALRQIAFPVDTNVGRIAVRLGWVPLQPLPESLQLHLLELYPVLESIQKYLWPRLCKLDQTTLYELHYQMITFGKVFCTKKKPNCNACPLRGECRHFASAFASARLALPAPEEKSLVIATERKADVNQAEVVDQRPLALTQASEPTEKNQQSINHFNVRSRVSNIEPIIEEPATPEPECPQISEHDIEDMDTLCEDPDEIPTIKLNIEAFTKNVQNYIQENVELQEGSMSKALVVLSPEAASIPMPKLKNIGRLRTEHLVYELPDSHPLLEKLKMERREPDDPCFYLLAIWTPGETANSVELPHTQCSSQESGRLCGEKDCFSCNSVREADSQVVRGTILIPCRTAMRGSFPLNGTYFQVNEVFADHDSSLNPIDVPRKWLWNLVRRTVYFGTSIPTIFKGLSTEEIQGCFWRGYVCVRGFDKKTGAPRPLLARLHYPASKLTKTKSKTDKAGNPVDK
ncbi:protein ROS1-like isoform X2 [Momordica charantia]|uniref:Protein ROS1-like isoform X2 n=1 Tax=Momordica charantia TaxID=3673 RepID=A0A6J1CAL2_MOMCH|nr:protein ROS1-like isoform X2 [Momordica charantia]